MASVAPPLRTIPEGDVEGDAHDGLEQEGEGQGDGTADAAQPQSWTGVQFTCFIPKLVAVADLVATLLVDRPWWKVCVRARPRVWSRGCQSRAITTRAWLLLLMLLCRTATAVETVSLQALSRAVALYRACPKSCAALAMLLRPRSRCGVLSGSCAVTLLQESTLEDVQGGSEEAGGDVNLLWFSLNLDEDVKDSAELQLLTRHVSARRGDCGRLYLAAPSSHLTSCVLLSSHLTSCGCPHMSRCVADL
jgi:hypothetical protein